MNSFAVVGHPLDHSLSPTLFNAGFKALGLDYTYEKEDVESSGLEKLIDKVRSGEYSGLSITVPYKEEVIQHLDELTPEAKEIGAVNTVYLSNGKIIGENTDWIGFKKALDNHLSLENKKILIYGAGGVARACLYALREYRNNVFLTNRSEEKGKKLAQGFGVEFVEKKNLPKVDLFINATSSSLELENGLLVSEDWLKNVSVVFDLMYGDTLLTMGAKKLGLQTIDAKEMLLYQAIRQFEIFTGKEAPTKEMRKSIEI